MASSNGTQRAVVTRKSHSRIENGRPVTYRPGDPLRVTERELRQFGDRLRVQEEPARSKPGPKPKTKPGPAPPESEGVSDGTTDG